MEKTSKVRYLAYSVCLALAMAVLSSLPIRAEQPAQAIKLRAHSWMPETHTLVQRMMWWGDRVTKMTKDQVQFEYFHGGTLAAYREAAPALKSRLFDVGIINPVVDPKMFPSSMATYLPWLPTDDSRVICEASNEFAELGNVKAEYEKNNIKYLCQLPAGARVILSRKPIRNLGEAKGIRVSEAEKTAAAMWKSIGMNPIAMSTSEVFDALAKGSIDAATSTISAFDSWGYVENAKYLIILPVNVPGLTLAINLDCWNSLPKNVQKAMIEARDEVTMHSYEVMKEAEAKIIAKWKNQGVEVITFSKEELARFYANAEPITEEWIKSTEAKGVPARKVYETWHAAVLKYIKKYGIE
jgi:TRAP-type C4-dicarboxylate transport system substrate-binding protein